MKKNSPDGITPEDKNTRYNTDKYIQETVKKINKKKT